MRIVGAAKLTREDYCDSRFVVHDERHRNEGYWIIFEGNEPACWRQDLRCLVGFCINLVELHRILEAVVDTEYEQTVAEYILNVGPIDYSCQRRERLHTAHGRTLVAYDDTHILLPASGGHYRIQQRPRN